MKPGPHDYRKLLSRELIEAAELLRHGVVKKSADAIHDARIALRRSREYLQLVPFTGSERKLIRHELKKCMHGTSKARDLDSYLEHLRRLDIARSSPVVRKLLKYREEAYRDLNNVEARLSSVAQSSAIIIETLPGGPESARIGSARLRKELRRLIRRVRPKLKQITGRSDITKIHKFRIATKELRYLAELTLDSKKRNSRIKSLRKVQGILGDLHDIQMLRRLVASGELGEAKKLDGLLKKDEKRLYRKFVTIHQK